MADPTRTPTLNLFGDGFIRTPDVRYLLDVSKLSCPMPTS